MLKSVKTNPFPWFPWWPKVEESHYIPIIFPSGKGNRRFGRSAFLKHVNRFRRRTSSQISFKIFLVPLPAREGVRG
jgi:hypothetical protein